MAEQGSSQNRPQPSSYSSPHSYPSPSMQASYTYPPPHGQTGSEPYRSSPTGSNMPLPPLNLPPIRSIDGQTQAPPPPPAPGQQHMATALPPPVASMGAYYQQHPGQTLPPPGQALSMTSSPHGIPGRYALPVQGAGQAMVGVKRQSGKEIKRRTKTGCLTCRKRRIKCDETHPACRNCQKSKRECLGYEPLFVASSQRAAQSIQPASSESTPTASTASNYPLGYHPATSAAYTPSTHAPTNPPASRESSSYEISSAIDPALAGPEVAMAQPSQIDSRPAEREPRFSAARISYSRIQKRIKLDDLFKVKGTVPATIPPDIDQPNETQLSEMRVIFTNDYAEGLDKFFETKWYSAQGWKVLLKDGELCRLFSFLLAKFRTVKGDDLEGMRQIQALEVRFVWLLCCICRSNDAQPINEGVNGTATDSGSSHKPDDSDPSHRVDEVRRRVEILEKLITWSATELNPSALLQYPAELDDHKKWEVEFWRLLGVFVTSRGDDPDTIKELDAAMAALRAILGQRENRDVLYSMAIAQMIGGCTSGFPEVVEDTSYAHGPENPVTKLMIAKKFIESQAQGKGTNQVIQRICDMCIVSWSA